MSPIVSVLISAYNHERYVEACLDSVLQQTYPNIELIVIDDGSRDNTAKKIAALKERYAAQGKNFIFVSKANSGLSDTLNQALALATGKYICQFGSDDIMMADKTAKQVAFMEAHPDVAVCGGNALVIDNDGVIANKRQKFHPYREITFEHLFANKGPGIEASTCMIRKTVLDKEGGWDPTIPLEDMYMWFKLTSRGYRMVGFNDVLMYYRKHQSNAYKNLRYMYGSLLKTIAAYQSHPLYDEVLAGLQQSYFLKAAKGDKTLAREILKQLPVSKYNMKVLRGLFYLFFIPSKSV